MRMVFAVALMATLGVCASGSTLIAQGGSTGGVIGKGGKSASGGEDVPAARGPRLEHRAPSKASVKPAEPPKSKMSACARAVGTWFWVTEEVTIKSNGSIAAKGGPGNWTCVDGLLHVFWPGFIVPHEIFSISDDGNRLISQNTSSAPKRIR